MLANGLIMSACFLLASDITFEVTIHQEKLPEGITRIVIFDTNAYRNLTFGLSAEQAKAIARQLADAELAAGIKALVNPFVIWELVAHLADSNDPAYIYCMNAVVSLVEHTRLLSDTEGGVCRIADGETEICRQLFRRLPPNAEENSANLSKLASYVWKAAPTISDSNAKVNFLSFRDALEDKESKWLDHIEAVLAKLRSIDGLEVGTPEAARNQLRKRREYLSSKDFTRDCALGKIASLASLLGVSLTPDEAVTKAEQMETIFSTSLELMQRTVATWFDAPGINLRNAKRRRANFIWDTALCFGIGIHHTVGKAKLLLVTDDDAIHEASKQAGCEDRVTRFKDYVQGILAPTT